MPAVSLRTRLLRAARAWCPSCLALALLVETSALPLLASDPYQRERLSRPYAAAVERALPRTADVALEHRVQSVAQRLLQVVGEPELSWRVVVLESPAPDAFALANGFVYVFRGLLDLEPAPERHPADPSLPVPAHMSDDELAFILAHEMAHVTCDHVVRLQQADRSVGRSLMIGGLHRTILGQMAGQLIKGAVTSGYSRELEAEADAWGLRYAALAGYEPTAGLLALERLRAYEQRRGTGAAGMLSSHPATPERMESLRKLLASTTQEGVHGNLQGIPDPRVPTLWIAYEQPAAGDGRLASVPQGPAGAVSSPAAAPAPFAKDPRFAVTASSSAATSPSVASPVQAPAGELVAAWVEGLKALRDCCNVRSQAFPSLQAADLGSTIERGAAQRAMHQLAIDHAAQLVLVLHEVGVRTSYTPWPGQVQVRCEARVRGALLLHDEADAVDLVDLVKVREGRTGEASGQAEALAAATLQDAREALHERVRAAAARLKRGR